MTTTKTPRPPIDFAEIQARKKPASAECQIILDSDFAAALDEARGDVQRAHSRLSEATGAAELSEAEGRRQALEERIPDEVVVFRFESVGRQAFRDLVNAHPPTKAQVDAERKVGNGPPQWNDDTFPPAVVAACLIEPKLTEAQVAEMWNSSNWNGEELASLAVTAINVNRRVVR